MINRIDYSIRFEMKGFAETLFLLLVDRDNFENNYRNLEPYYINICNKLQLDHTDEQWNSLKNIFRSVLDQVQDDAAAFERNDPAAKSIDEVILAYPGFFAVVIYRVSNLMQKKGIELIPRMLSEYAHSYTGTDIHPGATIGNSFFIDHATGIVIGETVNIGDHVKIYQGVTLGAFLVKKNMAKDKRHPTIEDYVTIYANATILGGDTVIGHNSVVGASVWLTESIPPNTFVSYKSEIRIKSQNE